MFINLVWHKIKSVECPVRVECTIGFFLIVVIRYKERERKRASEYDLNTIGFSQNKHTQTHRHTYACIAREREKMCIIRISRNYFTNVRDLCPAL